MTARIVDVPTPATPWSARWARDEVAGLAAVAAVAVAASAFAHAFRAASLVVVQALSGRRDPTRAAAHLTHLHVVAVVGVAAAAAAWIAHRGTRRGGRRPAPPVGLTAVAAAARGEAPPPPLTGTLTRAAATWVATAGMVSVGRESAILETGGTLGALAEHRLGRFRGALAAAGLSAAFATAYHAPLAAALYVEEHLGVRRRRRAVAYTLLAAAVSVVLSRTVFEARPIFPRHTGDYPGMAALGLLAVVPATMGSRVFLRLRERTAVAARDHLPTTARVVLLAVAVATIVSLAALTAGNGMEALRFASTHTTLTVALVLAAGKLLATTAALAAGVPGGAFSPTMATAAGWALIAFLGVQDLGLPLPGHLWDGMLMAMVSGVAVGMQAPMTAVVAVPEMANDLALVPLAALTALAATALNRLLDGRHGVVPARHRGVHDEDA